MAYSVATIIQWSKICQPLAAIGEAKRIVSQRGDIEKDLHIKLYITRKDVEYAYAQDPASADTFQQANFLYALCWAYMAAAQAATGSGGSVSPVNPSQIPSPKEFTVSGSSYMITGATGATISDFVGFNLLFVRNNVTQSTVNQGASYYSWNKITGLFQLANGGGGTGAAQAGELFQLYPLI